MCHAGQRDGIILQQVEEFLIPRRIVEAAALALHLMAQAARRHDRDGNILRIAFDRGAQRLAERVAAFRAGNRELQHAHLQRHDRHRPAALVRQQDRQRREAAMIQRLVLEERHVELVGHQVIADVPGERPVALDRRQVARAAPLVRNRIFLADAQAEGGIMIEEEGCDVIVVDHEQRIGLLLVQPGADRGVSLEDRLPHRILALPAVERETDGRRVRCRDRADDAGHIVSPNL